MSNHVDLFVAEETIESSIYVRVDLDRIILKPFEIFSKHEKYGVIITCLKSLTRRLMRMSRTFVAKGTHCALPAWCRQRFIRRAVEYSSPYMLRSVLARYSHTSQEIRPRDRRLRLMTSLVKQVLIVIGCSVHLEIIQC